MREMLRLVARLLATPILAASFGFMWLGFVLFIGPFFSIFSFLVNDPFSWREHIKDCNEFFTEPFSRMWGHP